MLVFGSGFSDCKELRRQQSMHACWVTDPEPTIPQNLNPRLLLRPGTRNSSLRSLATAISWPSTLRNHQHLSFLLTYTVFYTTILYYTMPQKPFMALSDLSLFRDVRLVGRGCLESRTHSTHEAPICKETIKVVRTTMRPALDNCALNYTLNPSELSLIESLGALRIRANGTPSTTWAEESLPCIFYIGYDVLCMCFRAEGLSLDVGYAASVGRLRKQTAEYVAILCRDRR